MKLSRNQLRKLIKESVLNEWGDAISGPGMSAGGSHDTAAFVSKSMASSISPYVRKRLMVPITEIIIGFTPAGFVIDVKDIGSALGEMYKSGGSEGKINLALGALGIVPGAGDAMKAAVKLRQSVKAAAKSVGNTKKMTDAVAKDLGNDIANDLKKEGII